MMHGQKNIKLDKTQCLLWTPTCCVIHYILCIWIAKVLHTCQVKQTYFFLYFAETF